MKFVDELAEESTCLKRVTVCILFDAEGRRLAAESNRCAPPDGVCARIGRVDTQESYPSACECRWEHAERRALAALAPGEHPTEARLYGHDFPCGDCEAALRSAGVRHIAVVPSGYGTGLR